jgi:hypothetical protein
LTFRRAATGNATDSSVIVWGPLPLTADMAAVRRRFCAIARRDLTRSEWRLFVPGEPYHHTCLDRPRSPT